MSHARHRFVAAGAAALTGLAGVALGPSSAVGAPTASGADAPYNVKTPTSKGFGGAVTSVDPEASRIGLRVLKKGGNAVDAAVATAAALGVTEPYSSGIGGGGYFVYYDAKTGKVGTIDGRETAPAGDAARRVHRPERPASPTTSPPSWSPAASPSASPARPATWDTRAAAVGHLPLGQALAPGRPGWRDRGFVVDQTFRQQTLREQAAVRGLHRRPASSSCPAATRPRSGSVFRNPDLAGDLPADREAGASRCVLRRPARRGRSPRTAQHPPKSATTDLPVPPGYMTTGDLARYRAISRGPTHVGYRGLRRLRHGAVLLRRLDRRRGAEHPGALPTCAGMSDADALHHYLEASALAFADRGEVRRRPGVRRRAAARPALRPVRRRAGLPDRPDRRAAPSRSPPATSRATTDAAAARTRAARRASRTPRTSRPPT